MEVHTTERTRHFLVKKPKKILQLRLEDKNVFNAIHLNSIGYVFEFGKGFNVKVAQGDLVKAGQTLIEFDLDGIKEAGYDPTVMTVVTDKHDVDIKLPSVE